MDRPHQAAGPDSEPLRFQHPVSSRGQGQPLTDPFGAPARRSGLFRFTQVEVPWPLGPPDGRYLMRRAGDPPTAPAAHVLVLSTLGAPERRFLQRRRTSRPADPEPGPTAVPTGRATVIDVSSPLQEEDAERWLTTVGEDLLEAGIAELNRVLHAFRVVSFDLSVPLVARERLLVARVGIGTGDEVAEGRWHQARELELRLRRQKRSAALVPQARLAGVLTGQEPPLICADLALRARVDLDAGRGREAALGLMIALDAAVAELSVDPLAGQLDQRVGELRTLRSPVADAAQSALAGDLGAEEREAVTQALTRLESALRARAAAAG